jgi:hypothetical protein
MRFIQNSMATVIGVALLAGPILFGQQTRSRVEDNAFMKAAPVRDAMNRLEKRADSFEDKFESALDKSSYNGGHTEDTLLRWADMLEDEIDNMVEDFKENDTREFIDHFENSMIVASAINRTMLRKDFATHAEAEWSAIRADLNHIATQMHRPVLPNLTVVNIIPATKALMMTVNVKQALEHIEASTDRFEEKFRKSVQSSTANMTPREQVWKQWADYLEDVSDDMLEEWKEDDAKEFQEELERTLMVAEAINRIMLRSDFSADSETEWANVRTHLNMIAGAFGYPVFGNTIK